MSGIGSINMWVLRLSSHLHVLLIQPLSASRGLRIDTVDEGRLLYTGLKWRKTKELLYRLAIAYEPRTNYNVCFLNKKKKTGTQLAELSINSMNHTCCYLSRNAPTKEAGCLHWNHVPFSD